jgi:hypothetical protein
VSAADPTTPEAIKAMDDRISLTAKLGFTLRHYDANVRTSLFIERWFRHLAIVRLWHRDKADLAILASRSAEDAAGWPSRSWRRAPEAKGSPPWIPPVPVRFLEPPMDASPRKNPLVIGATPPPIDASAGNNEAALVADHHQSHSVMSASGFTSSRLT